LKKVSKKVMWAGAFVEILTIILMDAFALFHKQIPDILEFISVGGMITFFIAALFVMKENHDVKANKSKRYKIIILLVVLILLTIVITYL